MFQFIKDFWNERVLISTPLALSMREWKEWRAKAKENYPCRYFLTKTIPTFCSRKVSRLRDAYWWVRHRIVPSNRYHMLDLRKGDTVHNYKAGWLDSDHRIQMAIVAVLRDYVEKELPTSHLVERESDLEAKRLYSFFFVTLPKREKHSEQLTDELYGGDHMIGDKVSPERRAAMDNHWAYDMETKDMVSKALHDCIDNMNGWWT